MTTHPTIGIIGGSGMLGRAIATALLRAGHRPDHLWISNRSGIADGFADWPGLTVTRDAQALAEACDLVILCVPPAQASMLRLEARDRLVVSVMAGVSLDRIAALTGATRVVRAMTSPAAARGLAYTAWCARGALPRADRAMIDTLFSALGTADAVTTEDQLDLFTAMTGPVPGFVAYFAACMVDYATARGVAAPVADRAIRQLFLAAGTMMATDTPTPAEHVQEMVDYAGTTAAGLNAMRDSPIANEIGTALDAAVAKARAMG